MFDHWLGAPPLNITLKIPDLLRHVLSLNLKLAWQPTNPSIVLSDPTALESLGICGYAWIILWVWGIWIPCVCTVSLLIQWLISLYICDKITTPNVVVQNYNYYIASHDFMRLRPISGLTWYFSCWMLLAAGVLQNSPGGWSITVERFKMDSFMLLTPWPKYLRWCFYLGDFFPFVKALRNSLRDQRLFIGQGNWISFLTAQGCKRLGPVCLSSYQPGSEAASCSLLTKSLMSQPDSVGWAASTGL